MDIPRSGRDLQSNGACVNDRWRTVVQWSWRSHLNHCETGKTERRCFSKHSRCVPVKLLAKGNVLTTCMILVVRMADSCYAVSAIAARLPYHEIGRATYLGQFATEAKSEQPCRMTGLMRASSLSDTQSRAFRTSALATVNLTA
jgi:hypothetical protein